MPSKHYCCKSNSSESTTERTREEEIQKERQEANNLAVARNLALFCDKYQSYINELCFLLNFTEIISRQLSE